MRKDPLLRQLMATKEADHEGLEAPTYKQDPLLRTLRPNYKENFR